MTEAHPGALQTESEPLFAAYGCRRHGPEQTQKSPGGFNRSMQQLHLVYTPVSETQASFGVADSA
jgi:hypothetical protein